MNLPTIGVVVYFVSTKGHPLAKAMNPKVDLGF
jgi:hypothetical protein